LKLDKTDCEGKWKNGHFNDNITSVCRYCTIISRIGRFFDDPKNSERIFEMRKKGRGKMNVAKKPAIGMLRSGPKQIEFSVDVLPSEKESIHNF